jgi:FAD/FMN-containing dehydrogenase
MLATNAGGLHVLRYGMARDLCLGLEAVMEDGSLLNTLKRVRKNNTGYDIKNLLIGSEGTLGIITAATLKIVPKPAQICTAFCAVDTPEHALAVFEECQEAGELLSAFELVSDMGFTFFEETKIDLHRPCQRSPWYVLIEFSGSESIPVQDILEDTLSQAQRYTTDIVIAQTDAQRQNLWAIRESLPEANRRIGSVSSHDIAVPLEAIPEFIDSMNTSMTALDASLRTHIFGHVGDGNLHANVFPAAGKTRYDYLNLRERIKRAVHDLADELGGTVSAEHGIGRIKVEDLCLYEDKTKLDVMRRIKQALDPKGLLNPDAIFND